MILMVTMQKMNNVDNAQLMFFPLGPIYLHEGVKKAYSGACTNMIR